MEKLLTIVIPTYMRREDVCKQVQMLNVFIIDAGLKDKIRVVVSDNHSEDGTYEALLALGNTIICDYEVRTQKTNIGGTFNSRSVIATLDSTFVMLLGDDDYLDPDYLPLVVEYLENDSEITAIFPNFHSNISPRCRDAITADRIYEKAECLGLMFKAHQMSGLVFQREDVLDTLFAKNGENRYYQMYCMGFNMLRGKTVHITRMPLCVNDTNKKFWTYGNDGLWEDLFKNVQLLEITEGERRKLERFYFMNYGWCAIPRMIRNPVKFVRSVMKLKNLSACSKWIMLPYMVASGFKIVYLKKFKKIG